MRNCNNYMSNTNLNQNRGNNMAIKNQNNCARKNLNQKNRSNGTLKDLINSNIVLNERRKEEECENLSLNQGKSRGIRVEDVLWWICFIFTVYYYDLPATLIFSRKINRLIFHMTIKRWWFSG
ncbi:unnamed protein product [Meloidogyne enterolobii]|uniref:Uncharacterized protein n=1 Tax=Meloidogyne enterolobii TaxID=390850 RepID=A0ACB1AKU9_MELEN